VGEVVIGGVNTDYMAENLKFLTLRSDNYWLVDLNEFKINTKNEFKDHNYFNGI